MGASKAEQGREAVTVVIQASENGNQPWVAEVTKDTPERGDRETQGVKNFKLGGGGGGELLCPKLPLYKLNKSHDFGGRGFV